jgi:hypothetical protein
VARSWLSIRVDLIEGRAERLWPRPGRVFAAARSHTFGDLADAIDYGPVEWDEPPQDGVFDRQVRLSRLGTGEQFVYTFDMGDDWTHLCTVGERRTTPPSGSHRRIVSAHSRAASAWTPPSRRRSRTGPSRTPTPSMPTICAAGGSPRTRGWRSPTVSCRRWRASSARSACS